MIKSKSRPFSSAAICALAPNMLSAPEYRVNRVTCERIDLTPGGLVRGPCYPSRSAWRLVRPSGSLQRRQATMNQMKLSSDQPTAPHSANTIGRWGSSRISVNPSAE